MSVHSNDIPVDEIRFRFATTNDVESLVLLNQQLIRDEGHRNSMTGQELSDRMKYWLLGEYRAVLIEAETEAIGYALYRDDDEFIYLRQFLIAPQRRRQGIGRRAIQWLWQNAWKDAQRLRVEVLAGNSRGRAFWQAVGFQEYCITMEAVPPTTLEDGHSCPSMS